MRNYHQKIYFSRTKPDGMEIDVQGLCPLLQVFDMKISLDFYCNTLGFTLHASAGPANDMGWAWLKWNDAELMLNTAYETAVRPPAADPARLAAHDDTCIYIGCPDVDEAYSYLLSKGLKINPPQVTHYGMKQLYLHDPDGYNLCFQWKT